MGGDNSHPASSCVSSLIISTPLLCTLSTFPHYSILYSALLSILSFPILSFFFHSSLLIIYTPFSYSSLFLFHLLCSPPLSFHLLSTPFLLPHPSSLIRFLISFPLTSSTFFSSSPFSSPLFKPFFFPILSPPLSPIPSVTSKHPATGH